MVASRRCVWVLLWGGLLLAASAGAETRDARAEASAGADRADAAQTSELDAAAAQRAQLARLRGLLAAIRALLTEQLDPARDPQSLFDVPLDQPAALELEARRLEQLLGQTDGGMADAGAEAADAGAGESAAADTRKTKGKALAGAGQDAGARGELADGGAWDAADDAAVETELWNVRLDIDRARLDFYRLTAAERTRLLEVHSRRQAEARKSAATATSKAEANAARAEAERKAALEAARRAKSEAARLVQEERARLLGVKSAQSKYEADLAKLEHGLEERSEEALGWRRRVDETIAKQREGLAGPEVVARTYDELVRALRGAEDELSLALDALGAERGVPAVGTDRLDTLGANVDRRVVDELRTSLLRAEQALVRREARYRRQSARLLMSLVDSLGRDRLDLLEEVAPHKRAQVTGFGADGLRQAGSELRQVGQVLRYHFRMSLEWLLDADAREGSAAGALVATFSGVKLLAVLLPFIWWRRRASELLSRWQVRLSNSYAGLSPPPSVDRAMRWLRIYHNCRGALEWLLVLLVVRALLPAEIRALFEIELPVVILSWLLGGKVVVDVLNAVAAESPRAHAGTSTAQLRLRSLNLVGRVVVLFGGLLATTELLVGAGTFYSWVLRLCWLAAIPIGLVLIRWWRPIIFERLGLRRKKNRFIRWAEQQDSGWKSSVAAAAGGTYLLALGAVRLGRHYLGSLEVTRRLLAYWFRREVTQRSLTPGSERPHGAISQDEQAALDPEAFGHSVVPSVADRQVEEIIARIAAPGGGLFAVVGERGAGKTSTLRRIGQSSVLARRVSCPKQGYARLVSELCSVVGDAQQDDLDALVARIDERAEDNALLVDDAQHLARPAIGGFDGFDRMMALARRASRNCSWVLAFDENVWRLLERARGVRPLFDEVIVLQPWSEESIAKLLRTRARAAGIDPSFEGLAGSIPDDADEIDRAEALARAEQSVYRVLWDYAEGNPAVALYFFRDSLYVDQSGKKRVALFVPPDPTDLRRLPDSSIFVLRAVIQLAPTTLEELIEVTALEPEQVADALRYTELRGYIERLPAGYRVTWRWYRAVTRLLQRRHLLAAARKK
jgi:flagellar biosynthesis GTPase FlhF